jgi:glycine cleavage system regulatory protein
MVKRLPTLYFGAAEAPPLGMAEFLGDADPADYGADSIGVEWARELATERGTDLLVLTGPDGPGVLADLADKIADNNGTITASTQVSIGDRALIVATFDLPGTTHRGADQVADSLKGVADGWEVWRAPLQRGIGEPVAGLPWRIWAWVDDETNALDLLASAGDLMEEHGVVASRVRSYPSRSKGGIRWLVIIEYSLAFRDLAKEFRAQLSQLGARYGVRPEDCSKAQVASYEQRFATPEPLSKERSAVGIIVVPAHRKLLNRVTSFLASIDATPISGDEATLAGTSVEMFSMTRLQRHHIVTFSTVVPKGLDLNEWRDRMKGSLAERVAEVTRSYPGTDASAIHPYISVLADPVPSDHDPTPMGPPHYVEVRAPEIPGILATTARAISDVGGNIESLISKVKDRDQEITCEIQMRTRLPLESDKEPEELHAEVHRRLQITLQKQGVSLDALDRLTVAEAKLAPSGDFIRQGDEHYMWAQPIGPFQQAAI